MTVGERFSHDVVREAVLAGMPDTIRTVLHVRRRARWHITASIGAGGAALASGGDIAQAVGWLMRAARRPVNLRLSEA